MLKHGSITVDSANRIRYIRVRNIGNRKVTMNRRKFISIAGATIGAAGAAAYLWSDKSNLSRSDIATTNEGGNFLQPDERRILFLASLAPSGHNAQPWFVQSLEPFHWIVGSDKSR